MWCCLAASRIWEEKGDDEKDAGVVEEAERPGEEERPEDERFSEKAADRAWRG